jgi:alkylated DNA repair dioxygenase AlkB
MEYNLHTADEATVEYWKRMSHVFKHPQSPFASGDLSLKGKLYDTEHGLSLLDALITTIKWNEDYCIVYGRKFHIPRLQAWYADDGIRYSYSNNLLNTQPWLDLLREIKNDIQQTTGHEFNSVLVTYYRHGNDHVSWHADDEVELGPEPVIASLSLGAPRSFQFRHKYTDISGSRSLCTGDLLLMLPGFQRDWEHSIPREPAVSEPRINLTFRKVRPPP